MRDDDDDKKKKDRLTQLHRLPEEIEPAARLAVIGIARITSRETMTRTAG